MDRDREQEGPGSPSDRHTCLWLDNVSRSQAVRGELEQSALKPDSGELRRLDIV